MDFREVLEYGEPMGKITVPAGRLAEAISCFNRDDRHFYACYNVGDEVHVKRLPKSFKREPRYVVFKLSDLDCLNEAEKQSLHFLIGKVAKHREVKGKAKLDGVFIESDWSCHNDAWTLVAKEYDRDEQNKINQQFTNPQP